MKRVRHFICNEEQPPIMDRKVRMGDMFVIDGQRYAFARIYPQWYKLICVENWDRWRDISFSPGVTVGDILDMLSSYPITHFIGKDGVVRELSNTQFKSGGLNFVTRDHPVNMGDILIDEEGERYVYAGIATLSFCLVNVETGEAPTSYKFWTTEPIRYIEKNTGLKFKEIEILKGEDQ